MESKQKRRSPVWMQYAVALAAVVIAILLRRMLDPILGDRFPLSTLLFAIILSAWYGGFGPAAMATVVGLLVSAVLRFAEPGTVLRLSTDEAAGLMLYFVSGMFLSLVGGLMFSTRNRSEATAEELRITLSSIGDAVIVTDAAKRVKSLNPIAEALTGWTTDEASGLPLERVFQIVNEHTRKHVASPAERALQYGRIVGLANHTVLISRNGTETAIDDSAAPIRNADGQIIGVVLVFRDVTERRRADETRRRLAAIVESSSDAIIGKDLDGTITDWNKAAEHLYGYTAAEVIGKSFTVLLPTNRIDEMEVSLHRLRSGERVQLFETVRRRKNGELIDVSVSYSPIRNDEGRAIGAAVITRDITEQKQAERSRNARMAVAAVLAQCDSLPEATPPILEALCLSLECNVGDLWIVDEDSERLRCVDVWHRPELDCQEFVSATRELTLAPGVSLPGRVWTIAAPVWMHDVADDERFLRRQAAKAANLHGGFACPILIEDNVSGVLEFFSDRVRKPTADLLETLSTICGLVAQFIERARAEESLRRSEQELADFFENASVGLHWVSADGTIIRANQAELELLGYTREEYVGRKVAEFYADQATISDILSRLSAGETLRDYPARLRRKDGSIRDVLVDTSGLFENGEFKHSRCFTRDVTDKKRIEDQLRTERARFAAVINHSPACIYAKDAQGKYLFANRAWAELLGRQAEDFPGRTDREFMPPELAEQLSQDDMDVLTSGESRTVEGEFPFADDLTHLIVKFPLRDADGNPYAVCGIATDITPLKRVEAELRANEERLRLALDAGNMGTWDWNIRTNEIKWSENLEPIHGLPPGTFDGTFDSFQQMIHPDDRDFVNAAIQQAVESQTDFSVEFRNIWPDGAMHWMLGQGRVYSDARGPARMVGVGLDVTDRKFAEETSRFLANASAELASLIDYDSTLQKVARLAVPFFADWCAVDMLNSENRLCRVAVAHVDPKKIELAQELHRRFPPDPEAPRGSMHIVRTGDPELVSEITDQVLAESIRNPEQLQVLRTLGLKSYIGVPIKAHGQVLGSVLFFSAETGRLFDESDLEVAEDLAHRAAVAIENARLYQKVRDADRRKDEFLAMLAHELRNPLAPIRTGLELLAITDGKHKETIGLMQEQVGHLVRLVDDLLDVSRIVGGKVELRKETVAVEAVARRTIDTLHPVLQMREQELRVTLAERDTMVDADPVRLAQIIENLLSNASKYTNPGGRIELSVLQRDEKAIIQVKDNGIGIEADLLPHVFELFTQSTRALDRAQGGLGIGLTLVRSLVEMHGGTIAVRSEGPGKGSDFTVTLPAVTASTEETPKQLACDPSSVARRILVVDDNISAANMLSMLLGRLGPHIIETAYDGPTALERVSTFHPEIVLLDIGLPGMDGYGVGRTIRKQPANNGMLLVALTGYGQEDDRRRSREAGFDEHLVKPTDLDSLVRLLHHPKLSGENPRDLR